MSEKYVYSNLGLSADQKTFRDRLLEEVKKPERKDDIFSAIVHMWQIYTKKDLRLQHINKRLTPKERNEVISNVLVLLLK